MGCAGTDVGGVAVGVLDHDEVVAEGGEDFGGAAGVKGGGGHGERREV